MSDPVVLLSTGDVVGPAGGVTDNSMVLFSGTSGKLIKGNNAMVTPWALTFLDDVDAPSGLNTLGGAPIASPIFTGSPKAPNPVQFDDGTNLATTHHVKQAGLQWAGITAISAATTLTVAHVGGVVSGTSATAFSVTMPATSAVPTACSITIINTGVGVMTLVAGSGDTISDQRGVTATILLAKGETAVLIRVGTVWTLISGTATLKYANGFEAVISTNGFHRLPSGALLQWGGASSTNGAQNVGLPIAYPNACWFGIACLSSASFVPTVIVSVGAFTTTTIQILTSNGGGYGAPGTYGVRYLTIGN